MDPLLGRVYVADASSNDVYVINAYTSKIVRPVYAGRNPQAIGVDVNRHELYVASNVDGTISVVSEATLAVKATVPNVYESIAAAVNSSTHEAYVTTQADTVDVITSNP